MTLAAVSFLFRSGMGHPQAWAEAGAFLLSDGKLRLRWRRLKISPGHPCWGLALCPGPVSSPSLQLSSSLGASFPLLPEGQEAEYFVLPSWKQKAPLQGHVTLP